MAKSASNKMNFTRDRVARFKCPADRSEAFLWDSSTPGLGIRARASGSRSYIYQGWIRGRGVRVTIGNIGAWDFDQAQVEARRLQTLIDQGIDPREDRKQREAEAADQDRQRQRQTLTLGDVWLEYLEARRPDWGERYLKDHHEQMRAPGQPRKRSSKPTKAGPLYHLHDERLVDLTAERLVNWLEHEKKERPTRVATAFRMLRALLTWIAEQPRYSGLIDPNDILKKDVRRAVPKPNAKGDVLQREQLAVWFDAIQHIHNPIVAAYFQGLLLTGARPAELAALRWSNVDFDWSVIGIADKVNGERDIPLTPYLSCLISPLARRNEFVFSSTTSASGHLTSVNKAHNQATRLAGLPHVTLHGLRRSFGTLSEWVECPIGIVAQIQGHAPTALAEKHYRRRPIDLLRNWHTRIEGWILDQAGIEQPSAPESQSIRRVR
ncbi:tyrosine-type recombinase/integrase [Salinisphaera orenii]|uniref:tyrosine-type recombinase/integrase n=1 Tax=Salinisphaera orenii TaxID=856731 RepID=UPI001955138E